MKKTSKDRLINFASIGVAATSLASGWWCIPLGLVLFFSVRAIGRKALYNEFDRLESRLMYGSQADQKSSIKELTSSKDPRAKDLLVRAMNNEIPEVQLAVAHSLLELGDNRAIQFLLEAMQSDNSTLRKGSAQLLADSGWEPQTPEERISQWLAFGDFSQPVGEGVSTVAALMKGFDLNDSDAAARSDIVQALARIGTPEVIDPLLHRMRQDESRAVRTSADKGLRGLVHLMSDSQRSEHTALSARLARKQTSSTGTGYDPGKVLRKMETALGYVRECSSGRECLDALRKVVVLIEEVVALGHTNLMPVVKVIRDEILSSGDKEGAQRMVAILKDTLRSFIVEAKKTLR